MAETNLAEDSSFRHIPSDLKTNNVQHQMASQLLGWDTRNYLPRSNSVDLGNFPGLCEVPNEGSEGSRHGGPKSLIEFGNMDISILRSIVTTEEMPSLNLTYRPSTEGAFDPHR